MSVRQLDLFATGPAVARSRVGLTFASLQSGSSGNATLVAAGGTTLLVDCGISPARLAERLAGVGRTLGQVSGVLLTHEHSDHSGGCGALARKHGVPLYATEGTALGMASQVLRKKVERDAVRFLGREGPGREGLAFRDGRLVPADQPHDLRVEWVQVPHDAREPVAFAVERKGVRVGVLTDVGHASAEVCRFVGTLDAVLLETNHDRGKLRDGPYPAALKRRISSPLGHLSNAEAARLVRDHASPRLRAVLLGHLSAVNNAPALAEGALRRALDKRADLDVALHPTFRDRAAPAFEL